jgi:hypothetical protein
MDIVHCCSFHLRRSFEDWTLSSGKKFLLEDGDKSSASKMSQMKISMMDNVQK